MSATGLAVDLQGTGEQLNLDFRTKGATYTDAAGSSTATRTVIKGQFDLNTGTARLDAVDVSAPEGSLFVDGSLSSICRLQGAVNATLRADLGELHRHLLHTVDNLSGEANFRLAMTFDPNGFTALGDAAVSRSTILGFAPGDFQASFRATPQLLALTKFELPLDTGKISAQGEVTLAAPYVVTADAHLDNMVLGELLERIGTRDLPVQLAATGKAHLHGPVLGPDGLALDMKLDTKVSDFGVYDRSFRKRRERGVNRYIGFTNGSLAGAFVVGSHGIEVEHAHIDANDTHIDLGGRISYDPAEGLHLDVVSPQVRVDELGPFGPAVCTGLGQVSGVLAGPYEALDIVADTKIRGLHVQGFSIGDVSGKMHLNLGVDVLDVTGGRGTRGKSSFTTDARLTFLGEPTLHGRIWLDGAHAIDLLDITTERFPGLATLDGNLDALVTGDVEVSGPARKLDVEARLALADVEAYGQHFDSGTLRTTITAGNVLDVSSFELHRGDAVVATHGHLEFDSGALEAALVTHDFRINQVDILESHVPGTRGSVALKLDAKGTLEHPVVDGKLSIRDWWKGDQPLAVVQLDLMLRDTLASTTGTITSPWPAAIAEPPHTPGTPWQAPPGSMLHMLHATLDLAHAQPFAIDADLSIPDLRMVLKPDALGPKFRGGLTGMFHAKGNLDSLEETDGELTISRLWVRRNETTLETTRPAVATLSGKRLDLKSLVLRGPSIQIDASGAREANGALDFGAQATVDLSLLSKEFPELDESAGEVRFEIGLNGNQAAPSFVGTAQLSGVTLRLHDLPLELTDGLGNVTFGKNVVLIDDMTARLNGAGSMSVSGELNLDSGYEPGAFRFGARLADVPFKLNDTTMVIAGTPEVTRENATARMQLLGDIDITRLRYTRDLDLQKMLIDAVELARRPPTARGFNRIRGPLRLEARDPPRRRPGGRQPAEGGSPRGCHADGNEPASGAAGRYHRQRRQGLLPEQRVLDLERRAELHRSDEHQGDLRRPSRRHGARVPGSSHRDGDSAQPHLAFTSEPVLSDADVVTLLTIGVVSKDFAGNSSALSGFLVDAAYNASGIPDQVKQLLPKNDLLRDPTFKVTSAYNPITGNVEPFAGFEGKIFRDDIRLRGETSLMASRGRKAELELKLRKDFDATAQWNDDVSARSFGDIGGDVHWHWEAP